MLSVFAGADTLLGGAGRDLLYGGEGGARDNVLIGGRGGDVLRGDAGIDTVSYREAAGAVVASLAKGGAGGEAAGATYNLIENLEGSDVADTLTGDAGINTLSSGYGDDILTGLGGAFRGLSPGSTAGPVLECSHPSPSAGEFPPQLGPSLRVRALFAPWRGRRRPRGRGPPG